MRRRKVQTRGDASSKRADQAPEEVTKSSLEGAPFLSTSRGFAVTLVLLTSARLLSASFNIIHDCDETYNYWEPLHYLLYKDGFQTWEYRSYLYIIIHYVFAVPLQWVSALGLVNPKLLVFFGVRCLFALASAGSEAYLVHKLSRKGMCVEAYVLICLLMTSAGMFISSTSFLPGTFSMYLFTVATASVLSGKTDLVIISCAASVILGWSVTAIAALPYALWVLVTGKLVQSLKVSFASAAILLALTFAFDSFFYGRYALSLYSFLSYNVFGSGDSALYGVENSTYYLRNGANNLNLLLPLSLLAPFLFIARVCFRKFRDKASVLLIACSPQWVWLGAITLLPHKEERFMYVVYPQIMLAASATIVYIGSLLACVSKKHFRLLKVLAIAAAVICSSALSVSRVGALLWNYNANMRIYMGIHGMAPKADGDGSPLCVVCMGSEWYEYPSSFFVPQSCKVNFLKSEFGGVLPAHFNASLGGTRSAAAYLNDRNEADDRQYIEDESACTFLVALKYDDKLSEPKLQKKGWNVVKELHYVQSSASKALYRALYIPFLSRRNLKYNYYVLYNKA